jgi:signal transduction histidine kinase
VKGSYSWIVRFLAIVIIYILLGRLGRAISFSNAVFSAAWPPTGFAVGSLVLFGLGMWPAIFCGAFFTLINVSFSVQCALGTAVGNSIEACAAAFLVRRFIPRRNPFSRAEDLFTFIGLAVVLAPMISATSGVIWTQMDRMYVGHSDMYIWFVWWLENMVGVLIVAPFVISVGLDFPPRWNLARCREGLVLSGLLILMAEIIFGGWFPSPVKDYPLEYLCIPFLVWAAFRFGAKGASGSILVLSLLAIYGTSRGFGPFYRSSVQESLHLLQVYIGTNGIMVLTLSAIVSERKQTERKLARSNAELERFAYLASHDLQEPLRTVSSFCRLLERRYKGRLGADADDYITLIVDSALRMHGMINSLLQYSRLGKGIHFGEVNCAAIVDRAMSNLKVSVEETGARVSYGKLPTINSDASLLVLLFQNIIGNAIKFRRDAVPEVNIRARREHEEWLFTVGDNGIGIDPQYCEKVFKLFQRAVSDPRYPGAGVGLAICRKIVEEHGGRIWMESKPGSGTKIFFTLPMSPAPLNRNLIGLAG